MLLVAALSVMVRHGQVTLQSCRSHSRVMVNHGVPRNRHVLVTPSTRITQGTVIANDLPPGLGVGAVDSESRFRAEKREDLAVRLRQD